MTPARMAALHARCFTTPRPWSQDEFSDLLADPSVLIETCQDALAILRCAGPEAEVLTICVAPAARRAGRGAALLARAEAAARDRGVAEIFLEVAADNAAARALYDRAGYVPAGLRKDYYSGPRGQRVSALVLRKSLTRSA